MFDKFKQIQELRNLQKMIKEQKLECEKNGTRLVMRGDFELVELKLNPALDTASQEQTLLQLFNEAKEKVQAAIAKDFAGKF